jgi:hypothetical protein
VKTGKAGRLAVSKANSVLHDGVAALERGEKVSRGQHFAARDSVLVGKQISGMLPHETKSLSLLISLSWPR